MKRRIAEFLDGIAAKEDLKVEIRFINKKIIPGNQSKSLLFRKKRILEFSSRILGELNEDEIKAIGLHEIGHLVRRGFLLRMANVLVVLFAVYLVGISLFNYLGVLELPLEFL